MFMDPLRLRLARDCEFLCEHEHEERILMMSRSGAPTLPPPTYNLWTQSPNANSKLSTFILNQGVTTQAYVSNIQINSGTTYPIMWPGGSIPSPSVPDTGNITDIQTVNLLYTGSVWTAYGLYYSSFA